MSQAVTTENKGLFTPFNIVAGIILVIGAILTVMRFTGGLGTVVHPDDNMPWGLWINFNLLCGVALAAGGYTCSAACYVLRLHHYHSAVRRAILLAFLGYALVVFALHYDVGRPWRLVYPIFLSQGTTSLLFEVGLCVFLYLTVLFIEFTPAAFEWLGEKKVRSIVVKLTMVLTIFGVVLSTLHQSSLGALFLIAPHRVQPLWYSGYLPLYFFVSSMFAGLSMVIIEGWLAMKHFKSSMDETYIAEDTGVTLGFARAASFVQAAYLGLKVLGLSMENEWALLGTGWGAWFLFELLGFVALPMFMFAIAARDKIVSLARWAAVLSVLGIVLNRLNLSMITFNTHLPAAERHIWPPLTEVGVTLFVLTCGLLAYRFIVTRMPIYREHPNYKAHH